MYHDITPNKPMKNNNNNVPSEMWRRNACVSQKYNHINII